MEIVKIKKQGDKKILDKSVKIIKNGGVIICPTDTIYGLICDYKNKKSVNKVFKIKKRNKKKLLPVFVKDIKMAKKMALISKEQEIILKKIWPGKITAVLSDKKGGKIGLRMPNYKFVLQLLNKTGRPLTATSANISGRPGSGDIKKIAKQFNNSKFQSDLIIDAGKLKRSKPSTVIDFTFNPPKILRP
jgi:L-threonylcarbamoyladenylate synthase